MRPFCLPRPASPVSGVLRGLRAAVLAVLSALLPVVGHVLTQEHAPRWVIIGTVGAATVFGALGLTRQRLTDSQLLGALAGAQLAYHLAYSVPGVCGGAAGQGDRAAELSELGEHAVVSAPSSGMWLAGHLITILLAARLLGVTERLLWQSEPLRTAALTLLWTVWPLTRAEERPAPDRRSRDVTPRLKSALVDRLNAGRAPPPGQSSRFGFPLPSC
ncbi:hypothetical protein [Streptomyces sp. NPDC059455]|uniref:hypothetical protein n=1 Tax=Streptomyces sp. NPDC059455 TaxID=3346837 RepID=UPI003681C8D3